MVGRHSFQKLAADTEAAEDGTSFMPPSAMNDPLDAPLDRRTPIAIPDGNREDGLKEAIYPPEYEGHFQSLMITSNEIQDRIKIMAQVIHEDYKKERPVMVCVLKGANPFYQNLLEAMQELKHGYTMEFLRVSSYEGSISTGNVRVDDSFNYDNLEGKHVLVIEDIVDTGTTLAHVLPILQEKGCPKSIQVCTLLEKRLDKPPHVSAKYIGFSIPNHFIVGYGLDYNELYRDTKDIWVISQQGIEFNPAALYS